MRLTVDAQLQWIASAFDGLGIPWWIDSGSMLGLVREGALMAHDMDIDFGVWLSDGPALGALCKTAQGAGYRVARFANEGRTFKVKFILRSRPVGTMERAIDINLFERVGGMALCPQPIIKERRFHGRLDAFVRGNFLRLLDRAARVPLGSATMDRWPWSAYFHVDTWRIPERFFDERAPIAGSSIAAPSAVDEYLTFRYGEWRIPKRDWHFPRDDRGLAHADPATVRRELVSGARISPKSASGA
jgi:hypothetical protein